MRNDEDRLLCKVNDVNGDVETEGAHKSRCIFNIPIGCSFTVIRNKTKSLITRTATKFVVNNQSIAA